MRFAAILNRVGTVHVVQIRTASMRLANAWFNGCGSLNRVKRLTSERLWGFADVLYAQKCSTLAGSARAVASAAMLFALIAILIAVTILQATSSEIQPLDVVSLAFSPSCVTPLAIQGLNQHMGIRTINVITPSQENCDRFHFPS